MCRKRPRPRPEELACNDDKANDKTMTRNTIFLLVASVLVCGSISIGVYEHHEVQRCRAVRPVAMQQRDELQRELRLVKNRAEEAQREANAAEAKREVEAKRLEELIVSRKAALAAECVANPTNLRVLNQYAMLEKSPEFHQLLEQWRRASYGLEYLRFAQKLNLTPEQTTAVGLVFDEFAESRAEMGVELKKRGLAGDSPLVKKMVQESNDAVCEKLCQIIGEKGNTEFWKYFNEMKLPCRKEADAVAMNLYYSATPLTVLQTDNLSRAINASTQSVKGIPQIDWDAVEKKAEKFMTEPQVAALAMRREYHRLKGITDDIYKKAVEEQ